MDAAFCAASQSRREMAYDSLIVTSRASPSMA